MNNEDGEAASGSRSSEERPTLAAIVDSTVKLLLPQLSDNIERQVSQAVKAALEVTKSAG